MAGIGAHARHLAGDLGDRCAPAAEGETWAKGVNRVVGTSIGAAVATACAAVLPANAFTVAGAVAVTILLCWSSGRLHDPIPLAALTTVLVFTFDRQEHSLAAGFWRCARSSAASGSGSC